MARGKRYIKLLSLAVFVLFLMSAFSPQIASATVTGDAPPASGDWIINQPTTVINENITIDGNLIVNNTLVIENSTIWFKLDKATLNVTENGALFLKNTTIRGYDSSIRWELRVYNGGTCEINASTIINAGYSGYDYQSGIWINSPNVVINNTIIRDSYVGIWVSNTHNVTIENTQITSSYTGSYIGIRMVSSNDVAIRNTTVDSDYFTTALRLDHAENVSVEDSTLVSNSTGFAVALYSSHNVTISATAIRNIYSLTYSGFAVYFYDTSNVTLLDVEMQSYMHVLYMFNQVENITVTKSSLSSEKGEALYVRGDTHKNINIQYSELSAKSSVFDLENVNCSQFSNNILLSSATRYASLKYVYNVSFANNILPSLTYGPYIVNSTGLEFINETIFSTDLLFDVVSVSEITIKESNIATKDFIHIENSSEVYLIENNITATGYGIFSRNIHDASFINNTIVALLGNGIVLKNSTFVSIEGNDIKSNWGLLVLDNSRNITVTSNYILTNKSVHLENSTYITFNENTILANQTSTELYNVTYSTLCGNTFTSYSMYGLLLGDESNNNTICGNDFFNSSSYGLVITNSTGNLIFSNAFSFNNKNGTQASDDQTGNFWDNGSLGNWYCNYNGSDLNHDGIGDTPFPIGPHAVDHYPIVIDNDNDSLNDISEILVFNTNYTARDTDGDGLSDGEEIFVYKTSPLNNDTDGDGMLDGWEVTNGLNATGDDASIDTDNDGLTNLQEYQYGTNPKNNDTDGDGMPDGWEIQYGLSPLNNDATQDKDSDGLTNLQEYQYGTDPTKEDTDGDSIPDNWEVQYNLNPLENDANSDADNDGLTNLQEYEQGTNPLDNDTDNDGLSDYEEVSTYNTDPLKADTDSDGLSDGEEVAQGLNPLSADTDGDGVSDADDFLPTINNYIVYGGVAGAVILAAVAVYFLKFKKR